MSREFRHILRVVGSDIDGTKKIVYGLTKIRGVGPSFAAAIVRAAEIKPELRMGDLSEAEVQKVEDVMRDPAKYGLPPRLFDRRKDLETGHDLHLIGADLALSTKTDIDFMKDIRSWKGTRHSLGLKVRGQHTRTTGRKGRAVGVAKKIVMEAARAAAAKEREEKK
jgi:small subunit ribosomal protein S13